MWRCVTLRFANLKDDWSAGITWHQICLLHCGSRFPQINMKCVLDMMGLHVRAKRELVKMLLRRETRTTPRKALRQSSLAGRCSSQLQGGFFFFFWWDGIGGRMWEDTCHYSLQFDPPPPPPLPPPPLPPIPHPAPRPWCPCFRFWRRKAGWKCTLI